MDKWDLHRAVKRCYLELREKLWYLTAQSGRAVSIITFIEQEVASWSSESSMSLRRRLWLWRHGFLSEDGVAYGFSSDDHDQYLSHYGQIKAGLINGRWKVVNTNKLVFHRMLEPFQEHRSRIFGRTTQGRFIPMDEPDIADSEQARTWITPEHIPGISSSPSIALSIEMATTTEWVGDYLRTEGPLVLKPILGGMGKDVLLCSWTGESYEVNGESMPATEFDALVSALDEYVVCEFVEQAAYATELFADATNTVRIITMWDDETSEAFVPIATHRIGTERSAPVDNCTQGGLTAEIDLETGVVGRAVQPLSVDEKEWYATHPDTGAQIEGVEVPGWQTIRDEVLKMAAALPETPYLVWDLIVTGEGEFVVIEANNNAAARFPQLHRPLLADPRVRRFYEQHGVI